MIETEMKQEIKRDKAAQVVVDASKLIAHFISSDETGLARLIVRNLASAGLSGKSATTVAKRQNVINVARALPAITGQIIGFADAIQILIKWERPMPRECFNHKNPDGMRSDQFIATVLTACGAVGSRSADQSAATAAILEMFGL